MISYTVTANDIVNTLDPNKIQCSKCKKWFDSKALWLDSKNNHYCTPCFTRSDTYYYTNECKRYNQYFGS